LKPKSRNNQVSKAFFSSSFWDKDFPVICDQIVSIFFLPSEKNVTNQFSQHTLNLSFLRQGLFSREVQYFISYKSSTVKVVRVHKKLSNVVYFTVLDISSTIVGWYHKG
jgi:hypothetical protein